MKVEWTSLLSAVPSGSLTSLSSRIISRIPQVHIGLVLKDEELIKISEVTSLTTSEVRFLVESLTDLFRSAALTSKRPSQLTKELKEARPDIPDETWKTLEDVWSKEAGGLIRALKAETSALTGGVWVEGVSWELGVSLASSSHALPAPTCKAVLNLDLRDASLPVATSSSLRAQRLSVQLDHGRLYDLFLTLETIQERMDALGK